MISVDGHYGLQYLPPSYEKLKTTLLKEIKTNLIKDLDVVKESWKETICTKNVMVVLMLTIDHH
jgi:hypothetical protein